MAYIGVQPEDPRDYSKPCHSISTRNINLYTGQHLLVSGIRESLPSSKEGPRRHRLITDGATVLPWTLKPGSRRGGLRAL
jgi:hypothetical protein